MISVKEGKEATVTTGLFISLEYLATSCSVSLDIILLVVRRFAGRLMGVGGNRRPSRPALLDILYRVSFQDFMEDWTWKVSVNFATLTVLSPTVNATNAKVLGCQY